MYLIQSVFTKVAYVAGVGNRYIVVKPTVYRTPRAARKAQRSIMFAAAAH